MSPLKNLKKNLRGRIELKMGHSLEFRRAAEPALSPKSLSFKEQRNLMNEQKNQTTRT
jgi:hypothetical protein